MSSRAEHPQEPLVSVIARLRSQGLDRYVNLPRIVLCGNQLSSKATVMEEVAGIWSLLFNMSPRSVTEFILVHSEKPSTTVTIASSAVRPVEQIERLKLFDRTIDINSRFRST
ncbi:dynamin family protein [Colletotrichum sojae]|uniref:Dynamin family protein n=1 Tax=Colletotrichum sojae TaxID=2175907 RepID=A0A8H6IQC5_9PEZI|nr:dynamin family protein [Colletotrichum sojae]